MNRDILLPVCFYLRNFNYYQSLDVPASTNGNLTLIGENAAGKTTLANCFFPMLVDGSIATPSFNPAKGTKGLDKSTSRNSSNDSRTFEGMLLGWGIGAMKVRTGYSYMLLRSQNRQVILGIGAHRAVGDKRKPTWWFAAISENIEVKLTVETTDKNGRSLEKDEFIDVNKVIDADFEVFSSVGDYQKYVSDKIYGFVDVRHLHQLAVTCRLLASPILTAGNASITPILDAMKNAQEGIDEQIIDSVAISQREVNRKNLTLKRLNQALERLDRIKKEIFWRNLNHLNELMLKPYSENDSDSVNSENNRTQNQRNLAEQIEQLEKIQPFLEKAENDVQILKEKKIKQQSIKEQRTIKQEMIDSLTRELSSYENLILEYKKQKENSRNIQDQLDKLNKNFEDVKQQVIPVQTDFDTTMVNLSNLKKIAKDKDISELISILKDYLRSIKNLITKFKNIEKNQNQLSDDVKIVFEIRDNMDEKIDLRVNSLISGKVRTGLHQDNMDVHKAGAAKMNIRYSALEQEKVDLLSANSDLKEFLNQKNLLTNLKSILDELVQLQDNMSRIQAEVDGVVRESDYAKKSVDKSEQRLNKDFKNFTTADQNKKITDLQKQMTELIIDPKLEDKISEANSRRSHYQESINKLNADKIKTQTNIQNYNQKIKELNSKIEELTIQVESNLKILKPYMINGYQLDKIVETLNFVNQNRSQIRNHRFSDLSEKIGYYIRHSGADGEPDRYALDSIFEERGYTAIASSIRQQRSIDKNDLRVVSFDINEARKLISDDKEAVSKSLEQLNSGNEAAQLTYTGAAVHQISEQYDLVDEYNDILAHGVHQSQGIQLKVALNPVNVDEQVISEARNSELTERPALLKEIQKRLKRLANDTEIAEDDDQFMESAHKLLDIRQWSDFQVLIHRKQAAFGEFELVDNNFVQSGGSGAEKAQAMVLPLLLVPKMLLQRSKKSDSPHMVMFDEFADKLDPDTAKSFARTIDDFGFSFIATMPSGSQNKVLADGIENIAYDVIAPKNRNDGKFHNNIVREAMIWQEE